MKTKTVLIAIPLIFSFCRENSDNLNEKTEHFYYEKSQTEKIDSIISSSVFKSKSQIKSDSLIIQILFSEVESIHFRRRSFAVDYSIFLIKDCLKDIHGIRVSILSTKDNPERIELIDTKLYNKTDVEIIKEWEKKDPLYVLIMSKMLEINYNKYEDLSIIAFVIVNKYKQDLKEVFDPDFAFFLEKYINEIYGETPGLVYRKYMEEFFYYSHDNVAFKYIKPLDVKFFLDYGDSVLYFNKNPKELEEIKKIRQTIPKEWPPLSKEV
jgi:hypothetical protein